MQRIGQSRDIHRLTSGKSLVLGGIRIPSPYAVDAHSDGDCLLHAIAEAMLGALALGDLGKHFPDTPGKDEGRDSAKMLETVYDMVQKQGFHLGNLDATVHLERPKLASHIVPMRKRIAEILGVATEKVSVKATRGEKVGPIGKEEAIMAECVLLLEKTSRIEFLRKRTSDRKQV